jgi:hypothetical protein
MTIHVSVEIGKLAIRRMKTKDLAEWLQEVVPSLANGEEQDSQALLTGIVSLMDSMTEMSEYISSDSKILKEFLDYHGYSKETTH